MGQVWKSSSHKTCTKCHIAFAYFSNPFSLGLFIISIQKETRRQNLLTHWERKRRWNLGCYPILSTPAVLCLPLCWPHFRVATTLRNVFAWVVFQDNKKKNCFAAGPCNMGHEIWGHIHTVFSVQNITDRHECTLGFSYFLSCVLLNEDNSPSIANWSIWGLRAGSWKIVFIQQQSCVL